MTALTARIRVVAGTIAAVWLVVAGAPWDRATVLHAQEQVLYLSITGGDGTPATDLDATEIVVRWDGEDSEILRLEPIDWPVRVSLFIDNSSGASDALGDIRASVKEFLENLPDGVEVGMLTLGGRPQWVVQHTTDHAELIDRVDLIAPDTGATSYLDALTEAAERLADDPEGEYLPVLVMVAADGPERSRIQQNRFETAIQRLIDRSATVHTRMLSHGNTSAVQARVADVAAQSTRGSFETLTTGNAFRRMLPELARQIARKHLLVSNQYRVTYRPPSGASAQPEISVGTTREGLTLLPTIDGNVPVGPR